MALNKLHSKAFNQNPKAFEPNCSKNAFQVLYQKMFGKKIKKVKSKKTILKAQKFCCANKVKAK